MMPKKIFLIIFSKKLLLFSNNCDRINKKNPISVVGSKMHKHLFLHKQPFKNSTFDTFLLKYLPTSQTEKMNPSIKVFRVFVYF